MKNTTKPSKAFSIFDWIKAIIDTKPSWETFSHEQQKQFNNYMIHRFLSMNPKYIEVVNYIQGLNLSESKKLYEVYCFMIPQSKNTYSAYIKSNTKKASPEAAQHVAEHFECSVSEAEEYISLTDKKWLENILTTKGVDEKEIKKLVK
tara:strand:+ start:142 stop:585 length:444 start_codon:yes stop_codon:yes gene_type:complete